MRRRRLPLGYVLIVVAFMWLATAIALAAWWPIHQSDAFVVMAVGTVLAATVVAVVGALLRWSSAVLIPIALAVLLAIGVPLAIPSRAIGGVLPSAEGFIDLLRGIVFGWKQLLTITLPVGDYQALLVPALVATFVTVVVAVSIALRARLGELAVVAPIALYVTGAVMGSATAWRVRELALALLVVALVWTMWRGRHRRALRVVDVPVPVQGDAPVAIAPARQGRIPERVIRTARTAVAAAVIMAVAGGAGYAAAAIAPPSVDRAVARTAIEQPFDPRDEVSPLVGFRRYLAPELRDAVLLTVTGLPEDTRIRLATLDAWNGVVYGFATPDAGVAGTFTRVPYRIDRSGLDGNAVQVDVLIDGYRGYWLPTVGELEAVEFVADGGGDFVFNAASGTGALTGGVAPGDEYALAAVLPAQPEQRAWPTLSPGASVLPGTAPAPDALVSWLDEATGAVEGDGARLVAAIERLRAEGYVSHGQADEPPSRAGHSSDRIAQLLTEAPMLGDAEQYAVAAALMARQIGFPARVVMGFVPGDPTAGGRVVVRGRDVHAWIEVETAEYGWVTIDPTPEPREVPERDPEEALQVPRPQTILPPPAPNEAPVDRATPPESAQEDTDPVGPLLAVLAAIATILGWTLVAAAVISAPFLAVIAAKLRRRRIRRRQRDPLQRIRGGWSEFEDALVDHGLELPPAATRREIAAVDGGGRARGLAALADRAVFGPAAPDDEQAAAVWREVALLRASLDEGLTGWQRLRARVSTRSLGRYSGRRIARRRPAAAPGTSRKGPS